MSMSAEELERYYAESVPPDVLVPPIPPTIPGPTVTSFTPTSVAVGSGDVLVSVTGTNYGAPMEGAWNTPLVAGGFVQLAPATVLSPTSLTFTIPAAAFTGAGNVDFRVRRPGASPPMSSPNNPIGVA